MRLLREPSLPWGRRPQTPGIYRFRARMKACGGRWLGLRSFRPLSRRSGCVPAVPYPPLRSLQSGTFQPRRAMIFQPTATTPLTRCLTPGVQSTGAPFWDGIGRGENRRRGCGNVGIAERFPRALGNEGNLLLVFLVFHRPSFPQPSSCTAFSRRFSALCWRPRNMQIACPWRAASCAPPRCRFRPGQCGPMPPASAPA